MRARSFSSLPLCATLLLATGPAAASPDTVHPFLASDLSATSRIGIQSLAGRFESRSAFVGRDVTVLTADLVADVLVADSLKLQMRLPVIYFADSGDRSGTGIGNATVGARFVAGKATRLGIGGSFSALTASNSGKSGEATAWGGLFRNLHDPGLYLSDAKTVRVEADLQHSVGGAFFISQLGTHILFFDNRSAWFGGDDQQNLLRFTVGGGFRPIPTLALLGEVTTFSDILEDADEDDFVHVLDTGIQYDGGGVSATFRAYIPLDEGSRTKDALGLGVDLLVRF